MHHKFTEDAQRGAKLLAENYEHLRLQVDYDDDNTPRFNLYHVQRDTDGGEIFSFALELDGSALFGQVYRNYKQTDARP